MNVTETEITFDYPALEGWSWPVIEIEASAPGPQICIMAGMHPNEVSSMEAAIRLRTFFEENLITGKVSIMPVVNMPGLYQHSEFVCPLDGKNINFCFPGNPEGSFSEALAYALLNNWARNAEVLIDMHGGDLREMVADFTMVQLTGNSEYDAHLKEIAACFDADIWVNFEFGQTDNIGRATNQSKSDSTFYVMSEGGGNGNLSEKAVTFHVEGCKNIARSFGVVEGPKSELKKATVTIRQFERLESPHNGRFYPFAKPGEKVHKGQNIGLLRDIWGHEIGSILSPIDGYIIFRVTHNIVEEGDWVFAVGSLAMEPS